jgi:peptidoglycan/xylan/chitin deacetylase (PgdA/CDA1 family)
MRAANNRPDTEPLESRFLLSGPASQPFCNALAADMRCARLSRLFRTYYALRALLPLRVRQMLQQFRRVDAGDRWAYPDDFLQSLVDQLPQNGEGLAVIHPWPDDATFAFVLTHDVETAEGMRRIAAIADMEEDLGFRSSWNFVPYKYTIDRGLVRDLADRGFEIGVHGYNHDGKLFSSRAEFDRRVPAINEALRSWGAVGFRAPMVHRNLRWMQLLDIEYDASCFDADLYQAMPGGVGSVWPFIAGRFVELPYTLAQDHTLFIVRNERHGRIWKEKLSYLVHLNGMALVITHPDYLDSPSRLEVYRQLLLRAQGMAGMWHALPRETAAWWRDRDALKLVSESAGVWHIEGAAASRARLAAIRPEATRNSGQSPITWIERRQITLENAGMCAAQGSIG